MTDQELQSIVDKAVKVAVDAAMGSIDKILEEKIQNATSLCVEFGAIKAAEIGAEKGAEIGASAAVKAVERERKKFRKQKLDSRLHNTKLLLRNYRTLNQHYENAVYDLQTAKEADEDFEEIMQAIDRDITDEALYIESIKQSKLRTKIIMSHVNKMLEVYKIMCEKSHRPEDQRHWRILYGLYLSEDPKSAQVLAEQECIDKRTVYKNMDTCISDMTALLFGIDGIKL